ncbi:hypothetical protein RUM43_006655 [Polyplax serrata]|uniref:Mitochondrial inner membrane protease subunit n=1 Tax=Polyplax serrata TaxID=468196 RepID=A0AAN8NYI2_POLSC
MNRITNVRIYARKCVGPSMEPTIYSDNIVFAEHLSAQFQKIKRGDIIITQSPFNPKHNICKRVIAIPGDKVRKGFFSQIVPKGHVWLEGDNKYNSFDSWNYGPVPQGLIRGRVVCRIWPLSQIKLLTNSTKSNV